jgi:hypothetical protein
MTAASKLGRLIHLPHKAAGVRMTAASKLGRLIHLPHKAAGVGGMDGRGSAFRRLSQFVVRV